jgi:hypothetical protein
MSLNVDNEFTFYLYHIGSKLVLCQPRSGTVANALMEGFLNTEVILNFTRFTTDVEPSTYLTYDFKTFKIVPANFTPSEKELDLIGLANLRARYLYQLEILLRRYVYKFCSPLEIDMHTYLSTLSLGEEFNTENPLVTEYSGILGISNIEGYNDLKLRFDSYGLLKIKAFAFFQKFKRQINECSTEQGAKSILDQAKYDLYATAQI